MGMNYAPGPPLILVLLVIGLYVLAVMAFNWLARRWRAIAWIGLSCGVLYLIGTVIATLQWYANNKRVNYDAMIFGALIYVPLILCGLLCLMKRRQSVKDPQ